MVGDLLLGFIGTCMAILVGYPLAKLYVTSYRERQSRRLAPARGRGRRARGC